MFSDTMRRHKVTNFNSMLNKHLQTTVGSGPFIDWETSTINYCSLKLKLEVKKSKNLSSYNVNL